MVSDAPVSVPGSPIVPEALAEPTRRVRSPWVTSVVAVNWGINLAFFAPLNVLIGLQATAIDEANKEAILSLVTAFGAFVALFANPLAGALSDRTTSRFGRRRPWVLGGALVAVVALLLMAGAPSVAMMVVAWCVLQAGANGIYASIFAAIPDRVPIEQRGVVGGFAAMGQTLGILTGAIIGFIINGNVPLGYWICAALIALSVILYLFIGDDPVLPRSYVAPWNWGKFFAGFWISPRKHPDFAWAWITRFLMFVGNQLTIVYLLFFLTDVLHHPDPAGGVLVLTGVYAVMTIATTVFAGRWSDKVGKRRVFVAGSSGLIAVAALIMAFAPVFPAAVVGAAVLGAGFGAYLTVDFALLTQVLPSSSDRGKDLGVVNIAAALPQVVAPTLALIAVTMLGGYRTMFIMAAVIGLLAAVLVYRIKSVP